MIEETLDVTELPVAKTVKDGDQLLLVRPNGDGTKTAMRIDGAVLKQTKVKKKVQEQYVIGRVVRPRACDQGHMVNWYVFGTVDYFGEALVYIPIQSKIIKGHTVHVEKVYIKSDGASDDRYYEVASDNKKIAVGGCFSICSFFIPEDNVPYEYAGYQHVIGIRVDRYIEDIDGHVSTVWLSWHCVPRNIKAASTHHWFEGGYRQYRPIDGDRSFIAQRIYPNGENFLDCFSDLEYKAIICKKMTKYNTPGKDKRYGEWTYIKILVFKRLNFNKKDTFLVSHAKCVGGLYRAIPIYSVCKTKGRPVYFYIRKMVKKSDGNYSTIRRIEWK